MVPLSFVRWLSEHRPAKVLIVVSSHFKIGQLEEKRQKIMKKVRKKHKKRQKITKKN